MKVYAVIDTNVSEYQKTNLRIEIAQSTYSFKLLTSL